MFALLGMDFQGNEKWVLTVLRSLRDPPLSPEVPRMARLLADIGLSAPGEWEYDEEHVKEQINENEPIIRHVLYDELNTSWRLRRDLEDRPVQVGTLLLYIFGGSIFVKDVPMSYAFWCTVIYLLADRYLMTDKERNH